jgi:hypothetical protein
MLQWCVEIGLAFLIESIDRIYQHTVQASGILNKESKSNQRKTETEQHAVGIR